MDNNNTNEIEEMIKGYEEYAKQNGFKLNPNRQVLEGIMLGLIKNKEKFGQKYCPCRRVSGNREADQKNICPCIYHKDEVAKDGHCYCRLFFKAT